MSAIIDFYQQQAKQHGSSIAWVAQLQEHAVADFARLGFPTRQNEEWKYTLLDSFLQQTFTQSLDGALESAPQPEHAAIPAKHCIRMIDGAVHGLDALKNYLPPGVIILPLAQALLEHPDKIQPYLSQIVPQEHGFQALNTAMLHHGLFIYLPAQVSVHEPLCISHWQNTTGQALHVRHLIVAEEGSAAAIIEDYQGDDTACYFTNTITEVFLAKNACLTHYKMQRESKKAYHIGHIAVKQAKSSQFNNHLFSMGGKMVRNDLTIALTEPHAKCLMNGIYLPAEGQHMDQHTLVSHNVPNCYSEQNYKGILAGRSRGVFNGKVLVAKDAQHTEAKQQNKNLLLSPQAEIDTKPQLDIYADDVICTHGATVGQLDEEALFYLATRGIGRSEATQYLIQAFATENIRLIPNTELATWMNATLEGCYE